MRFLGVKVVLVLILAGLILFSGCAQQGQNAVNDAADGKGGALANDEGNSMMEKPAGDAMEKPSDAMAEKSSYLPFTKSEYDSARAEGKIIFLEFYANWCPYCTKQKPINESAFASAQMPANVAGFQVNYKDSDTDSDEKALAREFGVSYQHTRIVLGPDGSVLFKATGNSSEEGIINAVKEAV